MACTENSSTKSRRPSWLKTAPVWSDTRDDEIDYCLLNDRAALVWAANLASLELHPFLHRAPRLERPESVVFDLDPGPPASIVECGVVALALRKLLASLDLECLAKTSGSKGLQVFVPLCTVTSYARTKPFAQRIAERLRESAPERVLTQMRRALRAGKTFIDWSQNDPHKTTVRVYSLRARPEPTVSTPVSWAEVQKMRPHARPENPRLRFRRGPGAGQTPRRSFRSDDRVSAEIAEGILMKRRDGRQTRVRHLVPEALRKLTGGASHRITDDTGTAPAVAAERRCFQRPCRGGAVLMRGPVACATG